MAEIGGLLWAKPSDEVTPKVATAYLHRPAIILDIKGHSLKVAFFHKEEDNNAAYLPGSILALPIQWVPQSACVTWDSGCDAILRQKERHVKRVLEERCQLWIVDAEYQRIRNILLGKEPLPSYVSKVLSAEQVRRLKSKGRFVIHPVGKIRKISTVSGRSGNGGFSDSDELSEVTLTPDSKRPRAGSESEKSTPTPVRSKPTSAVPTPKLTKRQLSATPSNSCRDSGDAVSVSSSVLDDDVNRDQVLRMTDEEIEQELSMLKQAQSMIARLAASDLTIVSDIQSVPSGQFPYILAAIRLALNAGTKKDISQHWKPLLVNVKQSLSARIVREWLEMDPVVREAALCVIKLIS